MTTKERPRSRGPATTAHILLYVQVHDERTTQRNERLPNTPLPLVQIVPLRRPHMKLLHDGAREHAHLVQRKVLPWASLRARGERDERRTIQGDTVSTEYLAGGEHVFVLLEPSFWPKRVWQWCEVVWIAEEGEGVDGDLCACRDVAASEGDVGFVSSA